MEMCVMNLMISKENWRKEKIEMEKQLELLKDQKIFFCHDLDKSNESENLKEIVQSLGANVCNFVDESTYLITGVSSDQISRR